MSGLAKIALLQGARVSGSDSSNCYLPELSDLGASIYMGHDAIHISNDIDLIVYTGAVKLDNVELVEGKRLNIPIMERDEFLGVLSNNFKEVIAVAGSHGKTTVTSMLGHIFKYAKLNPTIHVGGVSLNLKSNTIVGGSDYLIVEGCEYRESFLSLTPTTSVILNVDKDHLDYYGTLDNVKNAFNKFARSSEFVIGRRQDEIVHNNMDFVDNWRVKKIKVTNTGYKFRVYYKDKFYLKATLHVMGRHNIENSLFAIATCHHYNIPKRLIKKGLSTYLGVKRRYENIGEYYGVPVIADYAHHPKEISSSIIGIKERYSSPLIIFQPHTYSRTITLLDEFISVLSDINNMIIYSTYPAREKYDPKGSAYALYKKLNCRNKFYAKDMESLTHLMQPLIFENTFDVIVVLGAGNLYDKIKEIL